jgi:cell division septal protein FtsQ
MDDRIRQRRKDVRRWRSRRRLAVTASVLGVAAVVALFFVLRSSDVFAVRRILATPTQHVSEADIRAATATAAGVNLLRLGTGELERRLRALPYVRTAHVYRHFPDAVEVDLSEYEPQAVVQVKGGSRWLVAADGRVLASAGDDVKTLVLVTAVTLDPPEPGTTLRATVDALALAGLLREGVLWPADLAVARVVLSPVGDLTLVLAAGGEVRLGEGRQLEEKLMAAREIIKQYSSEKKTIEYVDVQDPTRGVGKAQ